MAIVLSKLKWDDAAQRLRQIVSQCSESSSSRRRHAAQALTRIKEGTYGYCMRCGMQIPERAMELRPDRQNCLRCESKKV